MTIIVKASPGIIYIGLCILKVCMKLNLGLAVLLFKADKKLKKLQDVAMFFICKYAVSCFVALYF
jgi:hypothetical protein